LSLAPTGIILRPVAFTLVWSVRVIGVRAHRTNLYQMENKNLLKKTKSDEKNLHQQVLAK
jgi:hypothetical protein